MMSLIKRKQLWARGKRIEQERIPKNTFTYQCACCPSQYELRFIEEFDEILCKRCCLTRPICEEQDCNRIAVAFYNDERDTKCRYCAHGDLSKKPIETIIVSSPMGKFVLEDSDLKGREEIYKKVSSYKHRNERNWRQQLTATAKEAKYLKAKRLSKLEKEAEELARGAI